MFDAIYTYVSRESVTFVVIHGKNKSIQIYFYNTRPLLAFIGNRGGIQLYMILVPCL